MKKLLLKVIKIIGIIVMTLGIIGTILFAVLMIVSVIDHWCSEMDGIPNKQGIRLMGTMAIFMLVGLAGFTFKDKGTKVLTKIAN